MKGDKLEAHSVDDCCVVCERHPPFPGGGHYFKGEENEDGFYEVGQGWLVVAHLDNCYLWLCPEHRDRFKMKLINENARD